jgi:Flp pilus assembly protein TadG
MIKQGDSVFLFAIIGTASSIRRFFAAQDGSVLVEFTVVVPILLSLIVGLLAFGMIEYQQMTVNFAAQAGADYAAVTALAPFNAAEITAIQSVVTSTSSSIVISATPAPTQLCGCVTGASTFTAVTCGSATLCAGNIPLESYVIVNAQAPAPTFSASFLGILLPTKLTAKVTVRTQ